MLCLTRRIGEAIVINGNITIRLLEQQAGKIRVGIEAPKAVPVVREELLPGFLSHPAVQLNPKRVQ